MEKHQYNVKHDAPIKVGYVEQDYPYPLLGPLSTGQYFVVCLRASTRQREFCRVLALEAQQTTKPYRSSPNREAGARDAHMTPLCRR